MNKILLGIFLCSAAVTAEPQTYHTLPDPSYQLVTLGKRIVIQDARGFFFGYYTPLPTPVPPFVPTSPQAPCGLYTGLSGGWSSVFSANPNPPVYAPIDPSSSNDNYSTVCDWSQSDWSYSGDCGSNSNSCGSGR